MIHYERARSKFCQVMAEGANRPQNVTSMHADGVIGNTNIFLFNKNVLN